MILATLFLAAAGPAAPDAEIRAAGTALAPALVETRRDIHRHPELADLAQLAPAGGLFRVGSRGKYASRLTRPSEKGL
jgi:hypothetical protein